MRNENKYTIYGYPNSVHDINKSEKLEAARRRSVRERRKSLVTMYRLVLLAEDVSICAYAALFVSKMVDYS